MAQHFAFVGQEFEHDAFRPGFVNPGYMASLSERLFDIVRRDPNVDYIEDDTSSSRKLEEDPTNHLAKYFEHDEPKVPDSYLVQFGYDHEVAQHHTVANHFAFLGREFELTPIYGGYVAHLPKELFDAVRRDPGVEWLEDITLERLGGTRETRATGVAGASNGLTHDDD